MPPLSVSVVLITYNRAHLVLRALNSVFSQVPPTDEVIVVDDGSVDATCDIVRAFDGVQLISQANAGPSAARNRGIAQATGDWIALLDSDDRWLPTKLETQFDLIERNPGYRLCHTEEIWIRNGKRVNQMDKHRKSGGHIYSQCLPLCVISPSSVLLHRTLFDEIGLFDETLPACEDYDLWLRICAREPVLFVDTPQIEKYGGHDDQLSRQHWGMDRFLIRSLEKMLANGLLTHDQERETVAMLLRKAVIGGAVFVAMMVAVWVGVTSMPTGFVRELKPLLDRFGNEAGLRIILFTLDETAYSRELAPLAGHYPVLKLGPAWWFHDSLNGMRRYFDQVMETAGIYNTAGFNDDTRAYPSIPARHDLSRRVDANWIAGMVVRGVIDMEDAREMIVDCAYRLAKKASDVGVEAGAQKGVDPDMMMTDGGVQSLKLFDIRYFDHRYGQCVEQIQVDPGVSLNPIFFRELPVITRAAIFARGTPMVLLTNGTVRDARGFTSKINTKLSFTAN